MEPLDARLLEAFLIALTQIESLEEEVQVQLRTLTLPENLRELNEIAEKSTTLGPSYQSAREKLNDAATTRTKGSKANVNEAAENRTLEKTNISVESEDWLLTTTQEVLQSENLVEAAKNSHEIMDMALIMKPA